ncbi:MAG: phosphomethylpyrimidine synthase ThiC [Verrucomicrobia bacterium]|nr:phosphomethylpyrimidine synthase ThiC [Verrucomicrobiota bacterium]
MTQIEAARKGQATDAMRAAAEHDHVPVEHIVAGLADGTIVVPKNTGHAFAHIIGVGRGLRTKTNANIGTSTDVCELDFELQKLAVGKKAGVDAVMDLSTGGDLKAIRKAILDACDMPLGTVPIYDAAVELATHGRQLSTMTPNELFAAVEAHCAQGVDFITVHCGVTRTAVEALRRESRLLDVVSRGGAILTDWILTNDAENPLYAEFDRLLEIARRWDITLSLGDGMRPGCLADATDRAQVTELVTLGELQQRALQAGVQAMIEGPGHIPLNEVADNVRLEKELCHGAPFYVLGPLVTDVAPGYDHITSAIGGAIAAAAGADFLCYVTPAEHLRLPELDDVHEGVIAARIAAHAGDVAKGIPGARDWDDDMARWRKKRNWAKQIELALDPERARDFHAVRVSHIEDACTMCSEFCAIRLLDKHR